MSRSENIKLALNSFLHTEKVRQSRAGVHFKVGEHEVHITNIPVCTCNQFDHRFFCKHVYNLLLFRFKINVRNKILYKQIWTDEQLHNILRKRYRQPSRPRQPRPDNVPRRRNIRNDNSPPSELIGRLSERTVERARAIRSRRRRRRRRAIHIPSIRYLQSPRYRLNREEQALVDVARGFENQRRLFRDNRQLPRQLPRRREIQLPPIRIPRHSNPDGPEPPRAPRGHIPHPPNFNPNRPLSQISNISPNRLRRLRETNNVCYMSVNNEYNIDEDTCSICLEKLKEQNNNHIITRCSHCTNHFHDQCIDTWIVQRIRSHREPSCPLCRSIIDM